MEQIGEYNDGQAIFRLNDKYAVLSTGRILVPSEDGFEKTDYYFPDMEEKSVDEQYILDHVVNLRAIIIDGFIIDLINKTIDGVSFKKIDYPKEELTIIDYKTVQITIGYEPQAKEEILALENTNKATLKEARAIIKAYDLEVAEYIKLK